MKAKHGLLANGIITAIAFAALVLGVAAFNTPAVGVVGLAISATCALLGLLLTVRMLIVEVSADCHQQNGAELRKP